MIRYKLSDGAKILFVGSNPHPGSYARGVPFSNNKTLWYLLNRAGVILEDVEDLRKDATLRRIYRKKFEQAYGLNFADLSRRPTRSMAELKEQESVEGARFLRGIIGRYRPKVVCFIGKGTYARFIGSTDFRFGWQKSIFGSRIYVMHSPVRGLASIRVAELRQVKRASER